LSKHSGRLRIAAMAILVGIDEAGYGPHLGPLVVAAAAIEFAGDTPPEPGFWGALEAHVRDRPGGAGDHVVICDSKLAYGGARDLCVLERTVLGFLAAAGARPRSLADLLRATCVRAASESAPGLPCEDGMAAACPPAGGPPLRGHVSPAGDSMPGERRAGHATRDAEPWDKPHALALPHAAGAEDVASAAGHVAKGLASLGAKPGGLWANAAPAARLNRLMDGQRNKAGALFALAADLVAEVQGRWPHDPIHVTMDRHGGRRYYAKLLAGAFPMIPVETLEESPGQSRYRLARGQAPISVTVRDRCETWSLPTALASMAAKYVRELHMAQLNAYFQTLVPGLRPTAGYGLDAWRFLDDVAAARAAAGVPDAAILRSR